jgi:hypothetical protein
VGVAVAGTAGVASGVPNPGKLQASRHNRNRMTKGTGWRRGDFRCTLIVNSFLFS